MYKVKAILREERLSRQIDFRQLEAVSGVSHGYLALAERSNVQPTLLVFHRWAKGLGVSLDEIIARASGKGA